MSMLSRIFKNIPKVDLKDYMFLISGQPKSGKTSLFKEICDSFPEENVGLLIAFEQGYKHLNINTVNIEKWIDFKQLADELIKNRNSVPYRFIGLDTIDELAKRAEEYVIAEWDRLNPTKRARDIDSVGSKDGQSAGFGKGHKKVGEEVSNIIRRLKNAGYGIMAIAHSKEKSIEQQDGQKFDVVQMSGSPSVRNVFVNDADFMIFVTSERVKTTDGVEVRRWMVLRNDGYIEAGSRFEDLPERIEYNVNNLIEVFKNAVTSALNKQGLTNIEELRKIQVQEKERSAKEFIEKAINNESKDELIEQITKVIDSLDQIKKRDLAQEYKKEFNTVDYKNCDDIEELKNRLEIARRHNAI